MYFDSDGKITDERNIPDGERSVAIGNRRLSILDLSAAGNQPIGNEKDGSWIVYNGEVYNYKEIRDDLKSNGYEFKSETDTEVILQAYREYGEDCVERLRGMFAFVVYDTTKDIVFGARDRFGIKPFYYHLTDSHFAFASEVTSLLGAGVAEKTLDPVGVDGFFTFGYVPGPNTVVNGIKKLPAGTTFVYDTVDGTFETHRYWSPRFGNSNSPSIQRIRELLEESVKHRLRSDVPVGAFLSGGLDSSTIVALMRAVEGTNNEDLHTFSIGFNHDQYTEADFAKSVAEEFGTSHHSKTVTANDVRENLDDIIEAMDQPTVDGVNTYFVSKLAADTGLKVALSGVGSDELFYGYPSFREVPKRYSKAKALYRIPAPVRRILATGVENMDGVLDNSTIGTVADSVKSNSPFGAAYLSIRGLFGSHQRKSILQTESETDWAAELEERLARTLTETDIRDGVSEAELTWYMQWQLLRDTDSMSMAQSLEVRVPFLDSVFADYMMGIDAEPKAEDEKGLLKRAAGEDLPPDILDREKTGFEFPFATWLKDELTDIVDEALSDDTLRQIPISPNSARSVRRAYNRGEEHWSRVWALVVFSLWVNQHLVD
jgi:asparagine synthase (glutamine-hydrolysing)